MPCGTSQSLLKFCIRGLLSYYIRDYSTPSWMILSIGFRNQHFYRISRSSPAVTHKIINIITLQSNAIFLFKISNEQSSMQTFNEKDCFVVFGADSCLIIRHSSAFLGEEEHNSRDLVVLNRRVFCCDCGDDHRFVWISLFFRVIFFLLITFFNSGKRSFFVLIIITLSNCRLW